MNTKQLLRLLAWIVFAWLPVSSFSHVLAQVDATQDAPFASWRRWRSTRQRRNRVGSFTRLYGGYSG